MVVRAVPLSRGSPDPGPHAVMRRAARSARGSVGADRSGTRPGIRRDAGHATALGTLRRRDRSLRDRGRAPTTARRRGLPRGAVVDLLGAPGLRRAARPSSGWPTTPRSRPTLARQGGARGDGGRRVQPLRAAPRPAGRPRRRRRSGDGAVRRRRWRRSTSGRRRATGSRGWSRRTSVTAIAEDFYREVAGSSTRQHPRPRARGARGHRARGVRGRPGARGDRGRPPARRPAGAVGPPAGGRGAQPGPARRRGARRAGRRCSSGGVDRPGADLAEVGRMFARLTENHTRRMAALGLSA